VHVDYYKNCIREINKLFPSVQHVVFSDEIEVAREIYDGIASKKVSWFGLDCFDYKTDNLAAFRAMCQANCFILGNSTFSFWAARLATNPFKVFYPWPMYKRSKSPGISSIPDHWTPVKSLFI